MKKIDLAGKSFVAGFLVLFFLSLPACKGGAKEEAAKPAPVAETGGQTEAKSAAELEKEKAMRNPYPNDLGPESIDVSGYSSELQQGYKLMVDKCSRCHSASRPLNSQFVDLKPDEIAAMKKSHPEIFKDKKVWQVEKGIWQRYVKRMMAKPGCNITEADGKLIFKFIRDYSKRRKTGANAARWAKHRRKLLTDFKTKYPERYKELFEAGM